MPDQTTDHLSQAVEASKHVLSPSNADIHYYGGDVEDRAVELVRAILKLSEPHFATYYEDKGRQAVREQLIGRMKVFQTLGDSHGASVLMEASNHVDSARPTGQADAIVAAEDKGRSEERERLPRAMTEFERKAAEREINREGPPDLGPNDVLRVTYRDLDPPSEEAIRAGQEAAFGRGWAIPEPIMVAILRAVLASLDSDQEGS